MLACKTIQWTLAKKLEFGWDVSVISHIREVEPLDQSFAHPCPSTWMDPPSSTKSDRQRCTPARLSTCETPGLQSDQSFED